MKRLCCLVLLTACSGQRPVDYEGWQRSVLAHELGHAAGLGHTAHGVMAVRSEKAMPATDDWRSGAHIGCIEWTAPADLKEPFEAAAEAWCIASHGEFCPVLSGSCRVEWAELDEDTFGFYRKELIQLSEVLRQ
jgi:hypothetical protein